MNVYTNPGVEKANDMIHQANELFTQVWLNTIVFTWRWWLLSAITISAWVAWIVWRNKESTHRLLFGGFFVMLAAYYIDIIGMAS